MEVRAFSFLSEENKLDRYILDCLGVRRSSSYERRYVLIVVVDLYGASSKMLTTDALTGVTVSGGGEAQRPFESNVQDCRGKINTWG